MDDFCKTIEKGSPEQISEVINLIKRQSECLGAEAALTDALSTQRALRYDIERRILEIQLSILEAERVEMLAKAMSVPPPLVVHKSTLPACPAPVLPKPVFIPLTEPTFKCPACGTEFRYPSWYVRHVKRVHKDRVVELLAAYVQRQPIYLSSQFNQKSKETC